MNLIEKKINARKQIARAKRALNQSGVDRYKIIKSISSNNYMLKVLAYAEMGAELPGAPVQVLNSQSREPLPNLGKLRKILEKELKDEQQYFDNDHHQSGNDVKRLALKQAVLDYYNDLPYDPETEVVEYEGDMTLRRDDKDVDKSDYDFAPDKDKIYERWMERLKKYIKENRLSESEYDESLERGIPQGGAFEKQLDRYRKDFIRRMWQEYYDQREV